MGEPFRIRVKRIGLNTASLRFHGGSPHTPSLTGNYVTVTKLLSSFRDSHIISAIIVTFTKRMRKMKDPTDKKTIDLLSESKKRGRPSIKAKSMTAAERKREQRSRQKTSLMAPEGHGGKPESEWTAQECLSALQDTKIRGTPIGKAAWEQLGKLQGFM